MKDSLYSIICLTFLAILPSLYNMKFTSLNPLIEVGTEIYCQHDENNETIFQIKKSGDIYTKVYKIIIPKLTPSKMWINNGTFADCPNEPNVGSTQATNKDDFIPVNEGEQYFFRIYGLNFYKSTPVLFLDEKDNYIKDYFAGLYSGGKKGVELIVPPGAKKMHITNYNDDSLSIQKLLNMTDNEIDKLCLNASIIMEKMNKLYKEYSENPVVYKKIKKPYISFVMDQISWLNEEVIDLFIEKDIPLSIAAAPEKLKIGSSNAFKTNLDVVKKLIATGKGEILSYNGEGVLTEERIGNYNEMYKTFIKAKQLFNFYGIEVNGANYLGGKGYILFNEEQEKWASSFYGYSDSYGFSTKYKYICINVHYHPKVIIHTDFEKMKEAIDKDIDDKNYNVYSFHSNNPPKNLSEFLDYVKQKEKEGKLEIGNYKKYYEKNAIRMKDLIKDKHTYYVSIDGKSEDGLSEKNPMNYETLKKKGFMTGDKVLLKRGDIYYGNLFIKFNVVDNTVFTLSSYGDKKKGRPILSGYKIVNKKESWEKETDNIYRIDLTNTNKFSGVKDISPIINRIGFMETKNRTKYYNLKPKLSELKEPYDFYSNETYFFVRTNGATPYEELGELKLSTRTLVLSVSSNMKVEDLHIQGGNYGIVGNGIINGILNENIEIVNNIIEDIGGSFLNPDNTRFGNGIDFYCYDVKNLKIHKNIIRNVYDTAFTIQGRIGGGQNVTLTKNIFVLNSQDSEIWLDNNATGIKNYTFEDNISFLPGRGWGYFARPDQYCATHILFWGINITNKVQNTDIYFNHNYVYNPRQIYFVTIQYDTNVFFEKQNSIRSDYNHYYMSNDSSIYRNLYNYQTRNNFISDINKDNNSEFILLDEINQTLVEKCKYSLDYKELRKIFIDDVDEEEEGGEEKNNSHTLAITLSIISVILIIVLLIGGIFLFKYMKNKNNELSMDQSKDYPLNI